MDQNLTLAENPIYGSKRIGDYNRMVITPTGIQPVNAASFTYTMNGYNADNTINVQVITPIAVTYPLPAGATPNDRYLQRDLGFKNYELTDHLGNVLDVVSDRKISQPDGSGTAVGYFIADVMQNTDYYPFGQTEWSRYGMTGNSYRFAYNGMEQDPEMKGTDNSYTTFFRQYDPRLGRWLSLDPKQKAWESRYAGFSNSPILYNDPKGDDVDPNLIPKIKINVSTKEPGGSHFPQIASTFTDEKGNVVGGTLNDKDRGVYKVKGLTRDNFDVNKISSYKQQGTKVGYTYSLYTFYNESKNTFMGSIDFVHPESRDLVDKAKEQFDLDTKDMNSAEKMKYYMSHAGNFQRYDLKTYGAADPKKVTDAEIYSASMFKFNDAEHYPMIMTRRDAGNFFAGMAANMIGLSKDAMLSGFGAYDAAGNKKNAEFGFKSLLNLIDDFFMGSAVESIPGNSNGQLLQWVPPFTEYKGSRDLQIEGYENK